jgi:hypothetical protein
MAGSTKKKLILIDDTALSLYDKDADKAVGKLADIFKENH